jgi:hypothetical protein
MLMLALIMAMYATAAFDWALNLLILSKNLGGDPASTGFNLEALNFSHGLFYAINASCP